MWRMYLGSSARMEKTSFIIEDKGRGRWMQQGSLGDVVTHLLAALPWLFTAVCSRVCWGSLKPCILWHRQHQRRDNTFMASPWVNSHLPLSFSLCWWISERIRVGRSQGKRGASAAGLGPWGRQQDLQGNMGTSVLNPAGVGFIST